MNEKTDEYKSALLRYCFTESTREVYESLTLTDEERKKEGIIITALAKFAKGVINETLERHTFNCREQEDGEKFDEFITSLRTLARNCGFCGECHNGLIRDIIVSGVKEVALRRKLLSTNPLSLQKAEEICRAHESAVEGITQMEKQKIDQMDAIGKRRYPEPGRPRASQGNKICKFCVKTHQWGRDFCPAWGKRCNTCGKLNHFSPSEICQQKTTNSTQDVRPGERGIHNDLNSLFLGTLEQAQQNIDDFIVKIPTSAGKCI